jgi:maleylpyruvate isomerase
MPRPSERIDLMQRGETFFLSCLERVDDKGLAQPCELPDWTRADVVAHMARNADALVNLLTWARTGDEKPMYPSAAARAAGIAASAQLATSNNFPMCLGIRPPTSFAPP